MFETRDPHRALTVCAVILTGSTFLRMLMSRDGAHELLARRDLRSLRLGTFCAEPVNEAVHVFAGESPVSRPLLKLFFTASSIAMPPIACALS